MGAAVRLDLATLLKRGPQVAREDDTIAPEDEVDLISRNYGVTTALCQGTGNNLNALYYRLSDFLL